MSNPHPSNPVKFKAGEDARIKGRNGGKASGESRRKYTNVMKLFQDFLEKAMNGETDTAPGEDLMKRMFEEAMEKGDVKAASFLFDRAYGKVPQAIDINSKGDHTIKVRFCKNAEEVEKWK